VLCVMMLMSRSFIKCERHVCVRSSVEKRVFDLIPLNGDSDMNMVRDAYRSCHPIKDKVQREACYLVFGYDEFKVEYYYPVVENLEKMYYKAEPMKLKLGFIEIKFNSDE